MSYHNDPYRVDYLKIIGNGVISVVWSRELLTHTMHLWDSHL